MRTDDFDYDLPQELIAQEPAEPRDSCRLLVLHRGMARSTTATSTTSSTTWSRATCS